MSLLNLSFDLYHKIFGYLNLYELSNCRLVCKDFDYFITKEIKIQELNYYQSWMTEINNLSYYFSTKKKLWFASDEHTDPRFAIKKIPTTFLTESPLNLQFLKRLKFGLQLTSSIFLNEYLKSLSSFVHLETLELKIEDTPLIGCKLSHPNLKFLSLFINFFRLSPSNPDFEIDTPLVNKLQLSLNIYIKYVHPLSVTDLFLSDYDPYFSMFRNVEHLKLHNLIGVAHLLSRNDESILQHFKKLKTLNLNEIWNYNPCNRDQTICNNSMNVNIHYFRQEKRYVINNLLQKKISLNRDDFKILSDEIELKNVKDVDKLGDINFLLDGYHSFENLNRFVHLNYKKFVNGLRSLNWLYYDRSIETLYRSHPEDFFKKLPCIVVVRIGYEIEDEDLTLKFIGDCRCLETLCVEKDFQLGQRFFDTLPEISSLHSFIINDNEDKLNYEFLSRMSSLKEFSKNPNKNLIRQGRKPRLYRYDEVPVYTNHSHYVIVGSVIRNDENPI